MASAVRLVLFFALWAGLNGSPAWAIEQGTQKDPDSSHLDPGDYTWQPDASPSGPVVIIVDLSKQQLQVYRNGVQIGRSTISAGKEDHQTPVGIFTILEKNVTHHSTAYHEASMPFMERLTWDGVAIHAGNVPGYPESHGCVHVPMKFAKQLYTVTDKGATVLVTRNAAPAPSPVKPDLEFSTKNATSTDAPTSWHPEASPAGPACIVFSSADQVLYIYRNGVEIGHARVTGSSPAAGNRVYTALAQTNPDGSQQWNQLGSLDSSPAADAADFLRQLQIPGDFRTNLKPVITAGTTLVFTDEPVDKSSSGKSRNILDNGEADGGSPAGGQ